MRHVTFNWLTAALNGKFLHGLFFILVNKTQQCYYIFQHHHSRGFRRAEKWKGKCVCGRVSPLENDEAGLTSQAVNAEQTAPNERLWRGKNNGVAHHSSLHARALWSHATQSVCPTYLTSLFLMQRMFFIALFPNCPSVVGGYLYSY